MEKEAAALPATGNRQESSDAAGCARSFDCTFCNRGFSSGQALGGHMNVHRKDKAKLKPSPPQCSVRLFPFDVSGSSIAAAAAAHSLAVLVVERSRPTTRQAAGCSEGRARRCSTPAAPQALFADDDNGGGRSAGRIDEEKRGHEEELDLELRLGLSETYLRSLQERK